MNLKTLFTDDDAVSPVIGVILMVAITVILAAVIGAFVLDLGGNQTSTPQASFDFSYENGADGTYSTADGEDSVEITHESGATINVDRLTINIDGTDATTLTWGSSTTWSGDVGAGDTASFTEDTSNNHLTSGTDVRVVWTSESGEDSSTIGNSEVP